MITKLLDRGILKVGILSVDLARREIDAAHVSAVVLAVDIFVRLSFLQRAFRDCRQIMVAFGVIVIRNQPSSQLADHFTFFNLHRGKQAIAGARDRRLLNDSSGFVLLVYF